MEEEDPACYGIIHTPLKMPFKTTDMIEYVDRHRQKRDEYRKKQEEGKGEHKKEEQCQEEPQESSWLRRANEKIRRARARANEWFVSKFKKQSAFEWTFYSIILLVVVSWGLGIYKLVRP